MEKNQVTIAWALAHAHAHHWAERGISPEARALAALLPAAGCRQHCTTSPLGDDWRCLRDIPVGVPPTTLEDAVLLGRLPTGVCGGIRFSVGGDGWIRHVSTTGRVSWGVSPAGDVIVTVSRPAGPVLVADTARGTVTVRGPFWTRHADALGIALGALGLWGYPQADALQVACGEALDGSPKSPLLPTPVGHSVRLAKA